MAQPAATPLSTLKPGQAALVNDVHGDDTLSRRLVDLGFWPGTRVVCVRRAPFGDPTQFQLQGFTLALRKNEAVRILVVLEESSHDA